MAATTLGSPSFNPAVLGTPSTALPSAAIEVVGGNTSTAMLGETDPIFSAWDKHTGITIHQSQIIPEGAYGVPTGLAATPIALPSGENMASVSLTWDAISNSNYSIRYKKSTESNYLYGTAVTNSIIIPNLIPDVLYNFSVASINLSGVYSAYSTVVNSTTLKDTAAPVVTTGLTATAASGSVILQWTASIEPDLAFYNIYRKTTNVPGTSTKIASISGTYFIDAGLTPGQIQYYWIKAVDTSGNVCATYSTGASATPTAILNQSALESLLGININQIATINPATGKISANTVSTLSLDNGAITEAKILSGAVSAAKLSVAAINPSTGEINANKVGTLQIVQGSIDDTLIANDAIKANAIATDAVTGPAIEASAITAGKLAVGAVTADKILAGAVTANKITSSNFVVSAGTFTSNTPAGCVTWAGCKVVYNGTEYTITGGNCDSGDKHIYWELATPTIFLHTVSLPALTNNGFLVAFNDNGTQKLVWNSTVVDGNRITTGSITASNIAANTLTANEIAANAITADKIQAGAVTANKIKSYNFMLNSTADGAVWTNNSPQTNKIAWSGVKVTYDGVTYTITNGNCNTTDKYIYWENTHTTFTCSPTLPFLADGDFIVGTNGNGTGTIPTGTMVFTRAGTVIDGNTILSGSIRATHIGAGEITANEIHSDAITSDKILANAITANKILAGSIDTSKLSFTPISGSNVVATINASTEGISIAADKVTISGETTFETGYDPTSKNKTFRQDAQPTAIAVGDLWIDTNDGNKLYICTTVPSGWTLSVDSRVVDMAATIAALDKISSDNYLSVDEKPAIIKEYDAIISDSAALVAQADTFGLSHVTYSAAVAALTSYLVNPGFLDYEYDDMTSGHDTNLTSIGGGTTFRQKFKDVYDAAASLRTAIAPVQGNWVKTKIDGGLVTTGSIVVGNGANVKAGMTGNTDSPSAIRFWAGSTQANNGTAPFRVTEAGNVTAESGTIGGWSLDDDAIYTGTKHTAPGFSHAITDTTIAADGSIHAPNFYINTDGTTGFNAVAGSAVGGIASKTLPLGTWAMHWNGGGDEQILLAHGLDYTKITNVSIFIIGDNGTMYPLEYAYSTNNWVTSGHWWVGTTYITIAINTAGAFYGSNHERGDINRGFCTIEYLTT
jgi:hypothetical protein